MMLTPKIIGVCAMPDFMLRVNFENGIDRIFDVKPYIIFTILIYCATIGGKEARKEGKPCPDEHLIAPPHRRATLLI